MFFRNLLKRTQGVFDNDYLGQLGRLLQDHPNILLLLSISVFSRQPKVKHTDQRAVIAVQLM